MDTDMDKLLDGDEIKYGTDPLNPDTDGDSILDGDEIENGTDPNFDDSNNEILVSELLTPGSSNRLESSWTIMNIEKYPNAIVEVYNRNGQKVFSKKGYNNNWQGDFKGSRLPGGSYYYNIYIPELDKIYSGWIFLTY